MYTITIEKSITASHYLTFPDGMAEEPHTHTWHIEASVSSDKLDEAGLVMDFHPLEAALGQILAPLENSSLNELPGLDSASPSAERFARWVYDHLASKIPAYKTLTAVEVTEAPGCRARYSV